MRRLVLGLALLFGLATPAAGQTLDDVQCSSTRVTRVSQGTATRVYADSIVIDRQDVATTRFLCRPKAGRILPLVLCSSTRTSRVANAGAVALFPDSLTFRRVDQDEARALCRPDPAGVVTLDDLVAVAPAAGATVNGEPVHRWLCPVFVLGNGAQAVRTFEQDVCAAALPSSAPRATAAQQRIVDRECLVVENGASSLGEALIRNPPSCDERVP
ncbi:MAG: hypothetical protein AB7G23_19175 [Vicinamibacterales bacterium]